MKGLFQTTARLALAVAAVCIVVFVSILAFGEGNSSLVVRSSPLRLNAAVYDAARNAWCLVGYWVTADFCEEDEPYAGETEPEVVPTPTSPTATATSSIGTSSTSAPATAPTIVENTYVTESIANPTTIIREYHEVEVDTDDDDDDHLSDAQFGKQVDRIYDTMGDNFSAIGESFDTDLLAVTGNGSVDGNFAVAGNTTLAGLTATQFALGTTTSTSTFHVVDGWSGYASGTAAFKFETGGNLGFVGNVTAVYIDAYKGGGGFGNTLVTGLDVRVRNNDDTIAKFRNSSGSVMTVLGNGRVGIGTTTLPDVHLTVTAGENISIARFNNNTGSIFLNSPSGTLNEIISRNATNTAYSDFAIRSQAGTQFYVSANGNVSISSSTPSGRLTVTNTGSGPSFIVEDSSADATPFVISAVGNVGIGTASPATNNQLHVSDGSTSGVTGGSIGSILITDATLPRLVFEDLSEDAGDRVMTISSTDENILFSSTDDAVSVYDVESIMAINRDGKVGIGDTVPSAKLSLGNDLATIKVSAYDNGNSVYGMGVNTGQLTFGAGITATGTPQLVLTAAGLVGIGTTTPSAQLSTTGTIRFSSFGSGSLQSDASGNITVSSDQRLKNIKREFTTGLDAVRALDPIVYKWKPETGYDTANEYAGFSAQNVRDAIPQAVSTDARGYLTLSDRPILAAVVNAVKEMDGLSTTTTAAIMMEAATEPVGELPWDSYREDASDTLKDKIADLGDVTIRAFKDSIYATVGIFDRVFAREVNTDTVNTDKLCVRDEDGVSCYTRAELDAAVGEVYEEQGGNSEVSRDDDDKGDDGTNDPDDGGEVPRDTDAIGLIPEATAPDELPPTDAPDDTTADTGSELQEPVDEAEGDDKPTDSPDLDAAPPESPTVPSSP